MGSFIVFLITVGIMASHDTPPSFDESCEDCESYTERMGNFFVAHKVPTELQVSRLLSSLSAKMYQLLRSLVAPDKPDTKSLDEINTVLKNHLSPKPLRFRLQKRLLSEDKLTFDKAASIAIAMEAAAKDTRELSKRSSGVSVTAGSVNKQEEPDNTDTSVTENESNSDSDVPLYHLETEKLDSNQRIIQVPVKINDVSINMELDTGCRMSVIPFELYKKHFSNCQLKETSVVLNTYTQEPVYPKGTIDVTLTYLNHDYCLELFVMDGKGPVLMGRSWLRNIKLDWKSIIGVKLVLQKEIWMIYFRNMLVYSRKN